MKITNAERNLVIRPSRDGGTLSANERLSTLSEEKRVLLVQRLLAKRAASAGGTTIPRREVKSPCALSFGQELMWVLDQLTPGSNAYNAPGVRHAKGNLDLSAFRRALHAIVERHEILRTRYVQENGIPVQEIGDEWNIEVPVVDLRGIPEPQRSQEAHRLIIEEAQRPFDLERDLMVRPMLVRLADDEHLVLFSMHHIATDGWSKEVMYREFATLYGAFSAGQPSPLPKLPIQFADFALWQRRSLTGERLEKLLSFWRRALDGAAPILSLPTDRPRPAVQTVRGAHKRFAIPRGVAEGIKALCQREGSTLYMVLLTAFKTLLYRYSGQTDILVGSPVAARNLSELEGLIGYFSNTLVMRTDLAGEPSFRELMHRVRETTLSAYEHQEMPFEKLVIELRPERDFSHTPLVQVAFNLHGRALGQALDVPGLTLGPVEIERGTAKFDLSLGMIDAGGDLFGSCEYNTDLFDEATVVRMQEQFRTLLEGIVENPDRPISALPLLPERERRQVLAGWNATAAEFPHDRCAHEIFEIQAERTPHAPAVALGNGVFSYRELNEQANQLAHYMRARGVGLESPVGICMESALDMPVAILGVLKAGGVYVPLDPEYPKDRLAYMIRDSGISLLLTRQSLASKLATEGVDVLCVDLERKSIALESRENPDSRATPANLAYMIFTSGSTGQPRGIHVPHGGMVNHSTAAVKLYGLSAEDRVLQFASISFDISVEEIFPTWFAGATLVLKPESLSIVGAAFARWLDREMISVLNLPTAYWAEWVHELSIENEPLPRALRQVIVGGEKATTIAYSAWQQLAGDRVRWVNTYGPTEATVIATAYSDAAIRGNVATITELPIGRPIDNVQVYVLDSKLRPVPIGVPGELCIGGVGVGRGYGNQPEATAVRFVPDPFGGRPGSRLFRTGDTARWRPDGNLEFIGRIDQQVKIRGFRIEPSEVEAVLASFPQTSQAAVTVCEDAQGAKRLVAYLVTHDGAMPATSELRQWLGRTLPEYMIPSTFVILPTLPLTPNGKVDRRALPAPDLTRNDLEGAFTPPRTEIEERLAAIWCEILGLERVGIHDDFFALGGHSLLFLRLWSRIKKTFGQDHPVDFLFRYRTIEQLACFLQAPEPAEARASHAEDSASASAETRSAALFCLDYMAYFARTLRDIPIQPIGACVDESIIVDIESIEDIATAYIRQLRESHPKGPYRLCGYCASALIAFEMARQLHEQGEEIPLLILAAPRRVDVSPTARRPSVFLRYLIIRFCHHVTHLATIPISSWPKYCRPRLATFFRKTPIVKKVAAGAFEDQWWRKWPGLRKAMKAYRPQTFAGKVTLLLASQNVRISGNRDLGWGAVAGAGLNVHVIPGEHSSIIGGKHADQTAAKIHEVYMSSLDRTE